MMHSLLTSTKNPPMMWDSELVSMQKLNAFMSLQNHSYQGDDFAGAAQEADVIMDHCKDVGDARPLRIFHPFSRSFELRCSVRVIVRLREVPGTTHPGTRRVRRISLTASVSLFGLRGGSQPSLEDGKKLRVLPNVFCHFRG